PMPRQVRRLAHRLRRSKMQRYHDFIYLADCANKYGDMYAVEKLEAFSNKNTKAELKELAAIDERVGEAGDSERISRWLDYCLHNKSEVGRHELNFSHQVGQLFVLFKFLGERDIPPFSS